MDKLNLQEYIVPDLNIPFIDRENEAEQILKWLTETETPWNHVIYGPWGCGKTELMKALAYTLQKEENITAIYIDLTKQELETSILTKTDIKQALIDAAKTLLETHLKIPANLTKTLEYLHKKISLKNKYLMLIIDELTATLNRYKISIRDYISALDKQIYEIKNQFKLKNIIAIIVTSEQTAVFHFMREEGKSLTVHQLWHLPRQHFTELCRKLGAPENKINELWQLTGGSPRAIKEIKTVYNWNTEQWLQGIRRVCIDIYLRVKNTPLETYLKKIVENIDETIPPGTQLLRQEEKLTLELYQQNIITPVQPPIKQLTPLPKENWIGKHHAWQLPAYPKILKQLLTKIN